MDENLPTIFALSSAPGRAGIAVVRLSGPAAGAALERLGGHTGRPRMACLRRLADPSSGAPLDDALCFWFPGPGSFTGEDVVELHVHGGRAVVEGVLAALSRLPGLAPAGPGDFARRAFANGKLDLTAVEGLADLIAAETEAQRIQALRQADGGLARLYDGWRERLIRSRAYVEAEIDFAEEDATEGLGRAERDSIEELAGEIAAHLDDRHRGERLRDGFRVVIAGPPNAGKSSLLNMLARREAAIVADEPGTTRDVIEVALDLGGLPVLVSDTAGLRPPRGMIEAEGIRRAEARIDDADLVVWLRDAGRGATAPVPERRFTAPTIMVWSKADLGSADIDGLAVSAHRGTGAEHLVERIADAAAERLADREQPALTRLRHRRGLELCHAALRRALEADARDELVAEELRVAATELGRLTGRIDVEDLLDVIFADFCIGK